jgi:hypothetical protein
MFIPERTVDVWATAAILRIEPLAQVWAPTPREQSGPSPWDIAASIRSKLFILENKGLEAIRGGESRVTLRWQQHDWLLHLQSQGMPIYYAIPCLSPSQILRHMGSGPVPRASRLRLRPRFDRWLHIVEPWQLEGHVNGARSRHRRTHSWDPGAGCAYPTLERFIQKVIACKAGEIRAPGQPEGRWESTLPMTRGAPPEAPRPPEGWSERTHYRLPEWHVTTYESERRAPPGLGRTLWILLPVSGEIAQG